MQEQLCLLCVDTTCVIALLVQRKAGDKMSTERCLLSAGVQRSIMSGY